MQRLTSDGHLSFSRPPGNSSPSDACSSFICEWSPVYLHFAFATWLIIPFSRLSRGFHFPCHSSASSPTPSNTCLPRATVTDATRQLLNSCSGNYRLSNLTRLISDGREWFQSTASPAPCFYESTFLLNTHIQCQK